MKIGTESICYQHQQAQDILERLLILYPSTQYLVTNTRLQEAIEWITHANDSAVRMENKLTEYKEKESKHEQCKIINPVAKVNNMKELS